MIKKAFSFALMMLCFICMSAQQPQPLPLNPQVKHGKLPNGLTYYLLHNEEPKERANFYIAQKVGSTLENESQLGLAHFLEHMAFNGTKNYPGKNMLNYLQANGLRFGADINAYTAFDETVYNIDNVPTTNQNLMDSVLLVLRDWSCDILLEDEEIDAERKVIQEEWRMRNDANTRMLTALLPVLYQEKCYQQMPIGTMDIVMNFPYQDLRDYYEKWYRPDQQGIIIVGDFNVDEMEQKVIKMFSDIEMPANAAERVYTPVSDNDAPIFFSFEDPELRGRAMEVMIKYDKIPDAIRNTDQGLVIEYVIQPLIAAMINERLNEEANKPDCPFIGAYVGFGDFLVAKTKGMFNISISAKDNTLEAAKYALEIVARALKSGFTATELKRVSDDLLKSYEKRYNERDKTNTGTLARELISTFTNNTPNMGAELEYQIMQQIIPNLPVDVYNQVAASILTPTNQAILLLQPQGEGFVLPTKDETLAVVNDAFNKEYEAYVDEVITDPLIAKLPKKGSIKSETSDPTFGTTELTLSNGIKVIVKPTDYKADEVRFMAIRKGGMDTYPGSQFANVNMLSGAFECVKFGPFDNVKLGKYLAGKNVSLGFDLGRISTTLNGSSSVKDFPTLMELIYTAFTNLGPDQEAYAATLSQLNTALKFQENDPNFHFGKAVTEARMHGNPFAKVLDLETLAQANYDEMFKMLQEALSNPKAYTFIFVGNVDMETLKPMLEQYIASLPVQKKVAEPKVVTPMEYTKGEYTNRFEYPMDTPSTQIFEMYSGYNLNPTIENSQIVSILGSILSDRFTRIIREQEGGAYSPYAYAQYDFNNNAWIIISVIQTNAEQQDRMIELSNEILDDLLTKGATADEFNKARGAALNQYENNVRTNNYWMNNIVSHELRGLDGVTNHRAAIEGLTLDAFNSAIKSINPKENFVDVVMVGVAK